MSSPSCRSRSSVDENGRLKRAHDRTRSESRGSNNHRHSLERKSYSSGSWHRSQHSSTSHASNRSGPSILSLPTPTSIDPSTLTPALQQMKDMSPPLMIGEGNEKVSFSELLKYFDPEGATKKMGELGLNDTKERDNIKNLRRHGIHLETQFGHCVVVMEQVKAATSAREHYKEFLNECGARADNAIERRMSRAALEKERKVAKLSEEDKAPAGCSPGTDSHKDN